ncbi:F0F1 ATP synthase subunit gamma [Aeromonas molluscorum]|uniref:F0F1 ATP synthase subunit gamma n=1 Tax=Aeromonas molluscorum TaxID=271417 RepID=UPI003F1DA91D
MSKTAANLRRQIASARDLESVVRTMKAMAASSIGQYESAVHSLDDYDRAVQLGLVASLRQWQGAGRPADEQESGPVGAVVFGSDQGLVGQFNESLVEFVSETLDKLPGANIIWTAGDRIRSRLDDSDFTLGRAFRLPSAISAISALVSDILIETESLRERGDVSRILVFHNRPKSGSLYEPICQPLLPLDATWQQALVARRWPTKQRPELLDRNLTTQMALIREYLFVSLYRACAESLASENASRLAAMQRAEKNIGELLDTLESEFHRLRQGAIDEELFDVISGFDALPDS